MTAAVTLRCVADMRAGDEGVVAQVEHPLELRRRLAELGIRAGQRIEVAQRGVGGSRIVAVGGARIAIDHATAARLFVAG